MNLEKTAVIADTGCDIPADTARELDIRMIPLHVSYPEKEYLDDIDIDPLMVYRRFPNEIPKTSMPSIKEIVDVYEGLKKEGYEKVIAVAISSKFSGTYNVMRLAAEQIEDMDIFVFDTKNISCGSGIFAYWAARMLKEGWSFEKVTDGMQKKIRDSHLMFYMDTLTYLKAGGRIGALGYLAGNLLNIKPIIACNEEGAYYSVAKCRGKKAVKARMITEIVEVSQGRHVWLAVMNGDNIPESEDVIRTLKELIPDSDLIYTKQIAATMAINTGPGLIGILSFDPSL